MKYSSVSAPPAAAAAVARPHVGLSQLGLSAAELFLSLAALAIHLAPQAVKAAHALLQAVE
jgi:hypothetical protein